MRRRAIAASLCLGALAFCAREAVSFERSFLLVIDDESLPQRSEQSTRDALRSFVRRLHPADRAGLAAIPHGQLAASAGSSR